MDWDPDFLARSAMFEPLRAQAPAFGAGWPSLAELQALLDRRAPPVRTASGIRLRVVTQVRRPRAFEERYEVRIFRQGELQVRERNWHDLLNVLAWLTFPRAKSALNARHYAALEKQRAAGAANRSPTQDALTLFDEGGVIVASDDGELISMLSAFRWKELFWGNRERVRARMRFHVFGHALHEKALRPFLGIAGRGIVLQTGPELIAAPLAEQIEMLDARIARHLADPGRLNATRELAVVPVLGVPGWCADNENEAYYDNTGYFRPGRRPQQRE